MGRCSLLAIFVGLILAAAAGMAALIRPEMGARAETIPSSAPTPVPANACAWQRAYRPLGAEMVRSIERDLARTGVRRAVVTGTVLGESCLDAESGEVLYFAPMKTDLTVEVPAGNLNNYAVLSRRAAKTARVLLEYSPGLIPGPAPGQITLVFSAGSTSTRLEFSDEQAARALDEGLEGAGLLEALGLKR